MHLKTKYLVFPLLVISELFYISIYNSYELPIVNFAIVSLINSVAFITLWILIRKQAFDRNWLYLVIGFGILFRLTLMPIKPIASDDIYRYIWDGKVINNGINPFKYAPEDRELKYLQSEILPAKINHPDMKTIYPPFSQFIFFLSYKFFGENFGGIKFLLLLSEVLTLILLVKILKHLSLPIQNVSLYALCPLPIMQFMVDGHIDGTGFPFLLLAVYLYINKKKISSFFIIGLSLTTKFISGMIWPFIWKEEKWKGRILLIIIPSIIVGVLYLPFLNQNVFPLESLFQFSANWIANSSIFSILFFLIKDNQEARLISLFLFFISGLILFFSRQKLIDKLYLIFFLFLIFSPTVHPWYVTWIALFLPISFRWSGMMFIALVNLVNILLIDYIKYNVWYTFHWLMIIEYLPVITIFIWELFKQKLSTKISVQT